MSKFAHGRLWAGAASLTCLLILAAACSPGRASRPSSEALRREPVAFGEEADRAGSGPAQEAYANRAYPRAYIAHKRVVAALSAALAIPAASRVAGSLAPVGSWTELGPTTATIPDPTGLTRETEWSGRVTSLAIDPNCAPGDCRVWVGAAGGGVWRTNDALATSPSWTPLDNGLTSNSIGSLLVDPNDPSSDTIYAGTGEPNGSGDSEAGVGLFKSTDGGDTWTLVPGSVPVSKDRSIGSIAVDPTDPGHIYIGTDVARHGSSSANGGRRTPPNAPELGLYESTDGGTTFTRIFSQAPNPNPPSSGVDWFQGGVNNIQLDPNDPSTVYVAVLGYGLWRRSLSLDGDTQFRKVFATVNPADTFGDRTEYDLVDMGDGSTRIYLGDSSDDLAYSVLYRVDDANVPAATLLGGGSNSGWSLLSSSVNGTPGFASYGFCGGQCGYDMFVVSPPGQPDTVWIGGQMFYDEIYPFTRSNGRTVQRSTDAGASFFDMSADAQEPPELMHPDQHAIVFAASDPNIAIVGSDGGVIRTSGTYVDDSGDCASRFLPRPQDRADCTSWLSAVPDVLTPLNIGLGTIQFQSLSLNPSNPTGDILGGTQDNGTFAFTGSPTWLETIGGDGGQSGTDAVNDDIRVHTYFSDQLDVNFHGTDPAGWDWVADPLLQSHEAASFYVPLITDPTVGSRMFIGLQHVWRTNDAGGPQPFLDSNCNEYTGTFSKPCGDWKPLGGNKTGDLTSSIYGSRAGQFVVAVERAPGDAGTMWAGTRIGRLFISKNADAADKAVTYTRLDTATTPGRFVSGIAIDPANPNHAFVSYSGYNAYTPTTPGHVFDVTFDPGTGLATFTNISYNIGDQPITDVALDSATGDLYASTDFGVLRLPSGSTTWVNAAAGLPPVAVYGLTIVPGTVLYAATHGRGAWSLALS